MNKPSLGYWSCLGGVEVKEIIYDIEDYVVVVTNSFNTLPYKKHLTKLLVKYNKNVDPFISFNGYKLYMADCIRY